MNFEITEQHLMFEVDGVQIPAALTMPQQGEIKWAMVIIPGSFLSDIDGNYSLEDHNPFQMKPHTYADLARQLAGQGHAVLCYSRAGTIVIDQEKAAVHRGFAERAVVVAQACRMVRELVPGAKACAVAGHSEGSVVALLLLNQHPEVKVDAYISLSGPAYRFFDFMLRQTGARAQDGILSFGNMKIPFALYKRSIEVVRTEEPVPDELKAAEQQAGMFLMHQMNEGSRRYLREYDAALDPSQAIAKVLCPVLIVQGGQDESVFAENGERLFEARNAFDPVHTAKAFFPDLQHFYKKVRPGMPAMEAFALEDESDDRVSRAISEWLSSLTSTPVAKLLKNLCRQDLAQLDQEFLLTKGCLRHRWVETTSQLCRDLAW